MVVRFRSTGTIHINYLLESELLDYMEVSSLEIDEELFYKVFIN